MNQVEKGCKISFPLPPPPFLSFSSRLTYSTMCHVRHAGDDKKTLKNDLKNDDVLIYSVAARSTHVKIGPPFNYFTLWAPFLWITFSDYATGVAWKPIKVENLVNMSSGGPTLKHA